MENEGKVWLADYNDGLSFRAIAKKYNAPMWKVYQTLKTNKRFSSRLRGGGLASCSLRKLSRIEAAYLAGIFDGEGSLTVVRDKRTTRGIRCMVCIVNTDGNLMHFLSSIGGPKVRWRKGENKPVATWNLCAVNDVWRFLNSVAPFLIVKREKTAEALKILKGRRGIGNTSKAWKRWHGKEF
jgi:hypothetical protein